MITDTNALIDGDSRGPRPTHVTETGRKPLEFQEYETKYLKTPEYVQRHVAQAGYTPVHHPLTGVDICQTIDGDALILAVNPIHDLYPSPVGPNGPIGYKVVVGFLTGYSPARGKLEEMLTELTQL